jgi:hypothetical protein
VRILITRAGAPALTLRGTMSLVTTEPAPITVLVAMHTPSSTTTLAPIQTSSAILIPLFPIGCLQMGMSSETKVWLAGTTTEWAANQT